MTRHTYVFSPLQLVPDPIAMERLNVGIVFVCMEKKRVSLQLSASLERVEAAFPCINGGKLMDLLRLISAGAEELQAVWRASNRYDGKSPLDMVHAVMPSSDSMLRWGHIGSGISEDPEAVIARHVQRYLIDPGAVEVSGGTENDAS